MSTRGNVLGAIVTGLNASTGINYASQDLDAWNSLEPGKYPAVFVIPQETDIERIAYPATSTKQDMEAQLHFIARGIVNDPGGVISTPRRNLIQAIEKSLDTSTAIRAYVSDMLIEGINEDAGQQDNYAIVEVRAAARYFYNHRTP
jgi:hypothetical protein